MALKKGHNTQPIQESFQYFTGCFKKLYVLLSYVESIFSYDKLLAYQHPTTLEIFQRLCLAAHVAGL